MRIRGISIGVLSGALVLVSGILTAEATAASSQTVKAAASCWPHASGTESTVGFLPQDRWTEKFTNNSCGINVRAVAICQDNFDNVTHTNYGGIVYGNGTSYYTCNSVQNLAAGYAQYYNGVKWVRL